MPARRLHAVAQRAGLALETHPGLLVQYTSEQLSLTFRPAQCRVSPAGSSRPSWPGPSCCPTRSVPAQR